MFFKKRNKKNKKLDFSGIIEMLRRNEIILTAEGKPSASDTSKIGGKPLLPANFKWPYFNSEEGEKPLSFLCQINLNEAKAYDSENLLPECGMLYFFYEAETQPWGFDPKDTGAFRVYYYENTEGFALLDLPEELEKDLRPAERALAFEKRASYPSFEELEFHTDVDGNADFEDYDNALEAIGKDAEEDVHKLLGYADIVQNEMLTECESVSRGNYCGSPQELTTEEEESISEGAKDWILLLQLSTLEAEEYELMWGDCGRIYFYIRKEDLKNKNFENTWMILQCG